MYVLFYGRVTELIDTNINFEFKISILNFEFKINITVSLRKVIKECFTSLNYNKIWSFKLKCI